MNVELTFLVKTYEGRWFEITERGSETLLTYYEIGFTQKAVNVREGVKTYTVVCKIWVIDVAFK